MKLSIPYGKDKVDFEIPQQNLMGVFPPKAVPGVQDESEAIRDALLNPIDSEPLPDLAEHRNSVVILATDVSRPTKDRLIVPAILDVLVEAGVQEKNVKVIVARGQHREMTQEEIERKLGSGVLRRVSVEQHDPDRNLVELGVTHAGNRVMVNSEVVRADLKISTGNIVPHRYAGYGGGAKSILPGVCGRETIYRNHLYVVEGKCRRDSLESNPVRAEMEEAAEMVGLDFIVNTVMNHEGRIVKVFSGHFLNAHRKGVEFASEMMGVHVPSRAGIVLSSGSPMDISFYQASKALEMGESIVKDGGTFILASPCYEGIGEEDLYRFLIMESPERILRTLKELNPATNLVSGVIAYLMAEARKRINVVLVSDGLTRKQVEAMGFSKGDSVQAALDKSIGRVGQDSQVAIFPQGPTTLPVLQTSSSS
ncbi:nickel-dependent lactate racemase [Candidatus Bathyarchaeota archaeon]|nr:nickel-dependent lactate racemase [Candidatus Bathyarchaeota archaeon]